MLKKNQLPFAFFSIVFLLWIFWTHNYLWLPGIILIYDFTLSQKSIRILRLHKIRKKYPAFYDWSRAIFFAALAGAFTRIYFLQIFVIPTSSMEETLLQGDYLFVSKIIYGPRILKKEKKISLTPPFSSEGFHSLRLNGTGEIQRGDLMVFNFPEGDSIFPQNPAQPFYQALRQLGREKALQEFGKPKHLALSKMDIYLKRCVALPGDTLEMKNGKLFINGHPEIEKESYKYGYSTQKKRNILNEKKDQILFLSNQQWKKNQDPKNTNWQQETYPRNAWDPQIFPHSPRYRWNRDNWGPIIIPFSNQQVHLSLQNIDLYKRLITKYENNNLAIKDQKIFINGKPTTHYTIKMNYFWALGDNRQQSLDSRYWGLIPDSHIIGKATRICLSVDPYKRKLSAIRWHRFWKKIN